MNYGKRIAALLVTPALLVGLSSVLAADGAWIVGARPAPPKGNGPGELVAWKAGSDQVERVRFGEPDSRTGNSFYVAFDAAHNLLFVPTVAGRTDIFDAVSLTFNGSMTSIKGGRVGRVSPDGGVLVVSSDHQTAGYSTVTRENLFNVDVGGNALAFDEDGSHVYVGGNRSRKITAISIPEGEVTKTYPVGRSADLVRVHQQLYSADMKTGVMSVIDLHTGKIRTIETPEVDPNFSYRKIGAATAGFMQLAADERRHRVYAAGFSGHVLVFDSDAARYLGRIRVDAGPPGGPDKLSGLALIDHDRALVTVENLDTAVVLDLSSQQIVRQLPHAASNRWVLIGER